MANHRRAEFRRGLAPQLELVETLNLHFALDPLARRQPGDMHLDPVDADFDLAPDLLHDFVAAVDDSAVAGAAAVRDQAAGGAASSLPTLAAAMIAASPARR